MKQTFKVYVSLVTRESQKKKGVVGETRIILQYEWWCDAGGVGSQILRLGPRIKVPLSYAQKWRFKERVRGYLPNF